MFVVSVVVVLAGGCAAFGRSLEDNEGVRTRWGDSPCFMCENGGCGGTKGWAKIGASGCTSTLFKEDCCSVSLKLPLPSFDPNNSSKYSIASFSTGFNEKEDMLFNDDSVPWFMLPSSLFCRRARWVLVVMPLPTLSSRVSNNISMSMDRTESSLLACIKLTERSFMDSFNIDTSCDDIVGVLLVGLGRIVGVAGVVDRIIELSRGLLSS